MLLYWYQSHTSRGRSQSASQLDFEQFLNVSQSVERNARDAKTTRAWWKARDGKGARAGTPFTKSEEKERLLAVYEQIVEGLDVVNCQLSNDLRFNRIKEVSRCSHFKPFQLIFTSDLITTNLLIYTEGNIYLNAWTKFPLNNRVNRKKLPPH